MSQWSAHPTRMNSSRNVMETQKRQSPGGWARGQGWRKSLLFGKYLFCTVSTFIYSRGLLSTEEDKLFEAARRSKEKCGGLSQRNRIGYSVFFCPGPPQTIPGKGVPLCAAPTQAVRGVCLGAFSPSGSTRGPASDRTVTHPSTRGPVLQ